MKKLKLKSKKFFSRCEKFLCYLLTFFWYSSAGRPPYGLYLIVFSLTLFLYFKVNSFKWGGLFISLIASIIVSFLLESSRHISKILITKNLLKTLEDAAKILVNDLYLIIIENHQGKEIKFDSVLDLVNAFSFPTDYEADCRMCESVLFSLKKLYEISTKIKFLERGLLEISTLNQIFSITVAYESQILKCNDLWQKFEVYRNKPISEIIANPTETNPLDSINSNIQFFFFLISDLFDRRGIFSKIDIKIVKFHKDYLKVQMERCKQCGLGCMSRSFIDNNESV